MADVISLSEDQVRFLRLRAQRLTAPLVDGAAAVARALCGLQAQEMPAATLGVRVRSIRLTAADVRRARIEERSVVRTWAMRGTLHLLATEDLGWLTRLFGPVFIDDSKRRSTELGLDEEMYARGVRAIRDVLASRGPLTRPELVAYLDEHGIRTGGQAKAYLVYRAALEGFVCFGPERGAKPTYVLLDDWIPGERGAALPREEACAELARRYLAAYGPAGPEDFAAWSGLSMKDTRAAWARNASALLEVTFNDQSAWLLKEQAAWLEEGADSSSCVRLLPAFDTYLLGYRSRNLVLAPEHARRVNAGGGMVYPTLLVGGRVVGTWKGRRQRGGLEVVVEPFQPLAPDVMPELEAEVEDMARFLEMSAALRVLSPLFQG